MDDPVAAFKPTIEEQDALDELLDSLETPRGRAEAMRAFEDSQVEFRRKQLKAVRARTA